MFVQKQFTFRITNIPTIHSKSYNCVKKKTIVLHLFFQGLFFVSHSAFSQDSTQSNHNQQYVSLTGYGSTARTPFWMRTNQYATVPEASGLMIRAGSKNLFSIAQTPHLKAGYGIDLVANMSANSQVILPELYGKVQFKKWELYVGRKRETVGLCDTLLGSGSYVWSGNALPIPKIQLAIADFLPLTFTKNLISFKGSYAHGWFGSGDFAYGYFLHQKTFYVRIGKPTSQLRLYGGFNHQVQWGGKTYGDIGTVNNRTFPVSFKDYISVVTGARNLGNTAFDSTNRVGNHLGTLDVGAEFEFRRMSLSIYRQSLYDDGSLLRKEANNIADGLQGIVLKFLYPEREKGRLSLKKVLFEFLYTKSQGGSTFDFEGGIYGRDNYFNHQQYFDGWSYKRRIIGTPFITNYRDTNNSDDYNSNEIANNNRVVVYHFGFEGYFGEKLHFLSKLSYSLNYGTYGFPYESVPKQFSGLLQVDGQIGLWEGLEWNAAIALDQGQLYTNTLGGKIGIRKTWSGKK